MEDDYVPKIGNRMGFIETIDDTLKMYRSMLDYPDDEKVGFEEKMAFRGAIEHIKHSDLYHLGDEFSEMLKEWADQYHDILFTEMRFSKFTRPPSNVCYVRFASLEKHLGNEDIQNMGLLTEYFEDGMTSITAVSPLGPPITLGAYHPDQGVFFESSKEDPNNWDEGKITSISNIILELAGCFELINNPRFIVSEAAGTRSQRKQMKREQNIPLEAWHKISWNVDETTVVINEKDGGGWRMPLHYTRGHPRKAEPHHMNIMYKDGKPYKWIEGFWSGHPAFGIKKGYHAPTLKAS